MKKLFNEEDSRIKLKSIDENDDQYIRNMVKTRILSQLEIKRKREEILQRRIEFISSNDPSF